MSIGKRRSLRNAPFIHEILCGFAGAAATAHGGGPKHHERPGWQRSILLVSGA